MTPIYKNGKYGYKVQINYKDSVSGKYKQITRCNERTRTKTDAKQYELELLSTIENGTQIESLTFEMLYYKFMEERKNDLKKNSLSYYHLVILRYVFPMFKNKRVDKITKENIIKWKESMQRDYDFALIYYNNILKSFSDIMNYAVKYYDLKENPITKVGKFKAPEQVTSAEDDKIDFWTFEEFSNFNDKMREHYETETDALKKIRWHSLYTTYNILFWSGLRRSEALALNYNDIVEINGVQFINVYKSINQRVSPYEITTTKNKSSVRKVPICNELKQVIEEQKEIAMKIYSFDESKFFICVDIKPLAKNSLGIVMKRVDQEVGIHHIRIHSLRHSYCSMLINGGFPLSTIARLLGHSTTDITQKVYSHIYPNANLEVINFMNNLNKK